MAEAKSLGTFLGEGPLRSEPRRKNSRFLCPTFRILRNQSIKAYRNYMNLYESGQIITTSAEVTLNGGLIRELPQNPLNSGLGIILICPDELVQWQDVYDVFFYYLVLCCKALCPSYGSSQTERYRKQVLMCAANIAPRKCNEHATPPAIRQDFYLRDY